jgi:glycosyltransferase involved in cell wall biosynthesis
MKHLSLGLVIPMYNEALGAEIVIKNLFKAIQNIQQVKIVIVDNGSTDNTSNILQILQNDHDFHLLSLEKNQGYGGGILDGMDCIKNCDIVGWMWGDNQIDPNIVPVLYQGICDGYPIAKTVRIQRQDGLFRDVQSKLYSKLLASMGIFLPDLHGCPKLFRRPVWEKLKCNNRDWFLDAMTMITALEHGYEIHQAEVTMKPRIHGKSKVNLKTSMEFVKNLAYWYWQR